jgi:alpha-galactosidase
MTELNRSADGTLVENKSKFPSGLQNVADQLRGYGLQFAVYSSAGKYTCGGYPGSLGYETQDAQWWASLGATYLKYDNWYVFCSGNSLAVRFICLGFCLPPFGTD